MKYLILKEHEYDFQVFYKQELLSFDMLNDLKGNIVKFENKVWNCYIDIETGKNKLHTTLASIVKQCNYKEREAD